MRTPLLIAALLLWAVTPAQACFSCSPSNPNGVGEHHGMGEGAKGTNQDKPKTGLSNFWREFYKNSNRFGSNGGYSQKACCT